MSEAAPKRLGVHSAGRSAKRDPQEESSQQLAHMLPLKSTYPRADMAALSGVAGAT